MATQIEALFIDDGGVLHDSPRRQGEWERLVGEYLGPRLGGTPAAWGKANRASAQGVWNELWTTPLAGRSHEEVYERYLIRWLDAMCQGVGIPTPSAAETLAVARGATSFVSKNVSSAFPGVPDAVEALAQLGLVLHTASGENSFELDGYLRAAGVRQHFDLLFGADLAGELKWVGDEYYREVFRRAGVDPRAALVVDDNASALAQAEELGATTVLVTEQDRGLPGAVERVLAALS